jgi:AcrR family transcriptional regulator
MNSNDEHRNPTSEPHSHPTKEALLDYVSALLDSKNPSELRSDEVLEATSISKGSLYHHFADFSDLIEEALVWRFSKSIDLAVNVLFVALKAAASQEEFRSILLARQRFVADHAESLFRDRINIQSMSLASPRFLAKIADQQERLTLGWMELIANVQEKGWGKHKIDSRAMAVLIQSTAVGPVIDRMSITHIDPQVWQNSVNQLIADLLFSD